MPSTLPRIKKRTTNVELNPTEIAILRDLVFRGKVDVMVELNDYTRRKANGTEFQREALEVHEMLRGLESKLDFAVRSTR